LKPDRLHFDSHCSAGVFPLALPAHKPDHASRQHFTPHFARWCYRLRRSMPAHHSSLVEGLRKRD